MMDYKIFCRKHYNITRPSLWEVMFIASVLLIQWPRMNLFAKKSFETWLGKVVPDHNNPCISWHNVSSSFTFQPTLLMIIRIIWLQLNIYWLRSFLTILNWFLVAKIMLGLTCAQVQPLFWHISFIKLWYKDNY